MKRIITSTFLLLALAAACVAMAAPNKEKEIENAKTSAKKWLALVEAIETITPMRDADGTWRVSGYFIK